MAQAKKPTPWKRWGALAACAALALGVGAFGLSQAGRPVGPIVPVTPGPVATPDGEGGNEEFWSQNPGGMITTQPVPDDTGDHAGFVAIGPGEEAKLMFPMISWVDFADVTGKAEVSASLALPAGAFSVPFSKEDIQALFWGPEGKPEMENPKTDPGDFPTMLMNWAGYAITGGATYDGSGDLWELWVRGEKGEDSFALRAAPGHTPPPAWWRAEPPSSTCWEWRSRAGTGAMTTTATASSSTSAPVSLSSTAWASASKTWARGA